jgi:carbon monoxide dehydrogenase subunit G
MKTESKASIETFMEIEQSPRIIWDALIAFSNYRNWNPIVKHAAIYGPQTAGTEIKMISGKWDLKFVITEISPPGRLQIRGGGLGLKLDLVIVISSNEDNSTIKIEAELGGWLRNLFPKRIQKGVEDSIDIFLTALSRRAASSDSYVISRPDEESEDEDDRRSFLMPTPFKLLYKSRKKKARRGRSRLT